MSSPTTLSQDSQEYRAFQARIEVRPQLREIVQTYHELCRQYPDLPPGVDGLIELLVEAARWNVVDIGKIVKCLKDNHS